MVTQNGTEGKKSSPRVRRGDERSPVLYRSKVREKWGVRQHPGLRVPLGREVAWYFYTTEHDSSAEMVALPFSAPK